MLLPPRKTRSVPEQIFISMKASALRFHFDAELLIRTCFSFTKAECNFWAACGHYTHSLYKPPQIPQVTHFLPLPTNRGAVPHHTMPAARCLVSLVAVLVAAVCVAHAQERIKMCGRELIRLAVSSCGSSRVRRSIPDLGLGKNQYASLCKYLNNVLFVFSWHIWKVNRERCTLGSCHQNFARYFGDEAARLQWSL